MNYTVDYEALRNIQNNANRGGSTSYKPDNKIVYSSQLSLDENEFAILPPLPHAKGIWFQKLCIWTIDSKKYVTNVSFTNGKDPLWDIRTQALRNAEKTNDTEMIKKINNWRFFNRTFEYTCPVLLFSFPAECINNEGLPCDELGNPLMGDSYKKFLVDEKAVVLSLNQAMFNATNSHITKRQYLGKLIKDDGYNFIGGLNSAKEYECSVSPNTSSKPLEFYKDETKIPDVWTIAKKRAYSDVFMEKLINWYLFGTEKPEKDLWKDNEEVSSNFKPKSDNVTQSDVADVEINEPKEVKQEVVEPVRKVVAEPKKEVKPQRNIADLLNDDDDLPF